MVFNRTTEPTCWKVITAVEIYKGKLSLTSQMPSLELKILSYVIALSLIIITVNRQYISLLDTGVSRRGFLDHLFYPNGDSEFYMFPWVMNLL